MKAQEGRENKRKTDNLRVEKRNAKAVVGEESATTGKERLATVAERTA